MKTDEQIIKALECCAVSETKCDECPYYPEACLTDDYESIFLKDVFDLINRKKAKIESLKQIINEYPVKTLIDKNNLLCSKTSEDFKRMIMDIANTTIKEFVEQLIDNQPATDIAEVVRCRDCKYMRTIFPVKGKNKDAIEAHVCCLSHWSENSHGVSVMESDFCSYGERAEQE